MVWPDSLVIVKKLLYSLVIFNFFYKWVLRKLYTEKPNTIIIIILNLIAIAIYSLTLINATSITVKLDNLMENYWT